MLATVKGDIHDIGKNIVKVLLENYGYTVVDLGKDVDPAAVVEAVRRHGAPLVGLSALMTTTLKSMAETIAMLHDAGLPCQIMVGGAVLTPDYARQIQADFYARDAKEALDWQQRGLGLYTMLCQYFDADGDGSISREEFETGPGAVREALEATFSGLDLDGDGRITRRTWRRRHAGSRAEIFRAIEAGTTSGFGNTTQSPSPPTGSGATGGFPPTGRPCPVWTCPSISSRGGGTPTPLRRTPWPSRETFRRLGRTTSPSTST